MRSKHILVFAVAVCLPIISPPLSHTRQRGVRRRKRITKRGRLRNGFGPIPIASYVSTSRYNGQEVIGLRRLSSAKHGPHRL